MKVLLFYPSTPLFGIAPSNLAILSACLKQAGHQVKLFDCTNYKPKNEDTFDQMRAKLGQVKSSNIADYYPGKDVEIHDDFVNMVEEYQPDLIGVSVLDMTISFTLEFLKRIDHLAIPVIAGGVGATFSYKTLLDTGLVDYVCIGEGEETLVELCDKLEAGEDCSTIQNIYLKKDGVIIKNSLRPLVNMDKIPTPDFSIYEFYRFYRPFSGKVVRMFPVDIDRGCPGNCTYCAAPGLRQMARDNKCGQVYRFKSFDRIFADTKKIIAEFDIDFLWLSAESLLSMPMAKFKEFAERYKKELGLPFYCQSRLDTFSEEKTKMLAEMGCAAVGVGLEHGSEEIRYKVLDKRITNEEILNSFRELSKYPILPNVFNMIGFPDETRENIFQTIRLNREVYKITRGRQTVNVFTFMPFRGTKLRNICLEKVYITGEEEFPITWFKYSIITMPTMTKEEIYGLERTFVLYVKLPEEKWPEVELCEKDPNNTVLFDQLMASTKT